MKEILPPGSTQGVIAPFTTGAITISSVPVETLFETREKKSSSLFQYVGTPDNGGYFQLVLRGFDGHYTKEQVDDIIIELATIVHAYAEATGQLPNELAPLIDLTDDEIANALVLAGLDDTASDADILAALKSFVAAREEFLGVFGDEDEEGYACECDECVLEGAEGED